MAAADVRRTLCVVAMVATTGWLVVLVVWQDSPFAFTFDDAYYYFAIARNVASGHGSTFDQISLTNGYHPLWLGLSVVPFALGLDDLAAARALLVFQMVVGWGLTLVLVGSIVGRSTEGWGRRRAAAWTLAAVLLLVAVNPFIVKVFVNGLESGVAVTVYAAILLAGVGSGPRSRRWRLGMSGLLALAFLARTDAILLIACLGVWSGAERSAGSGHAQAQGGRSAVVDLLELFALPALVVLAYLGLNQVAFATPVQVSGLVKRAPIDATSVGLCLVCVLLAVLVGRAAFRREHGRRVAARTTSRFPRVSAFVGRTGWFASFCILVIGYYNVLQIQQWLWYYGPVVLYLIILFLLAVADVLDSALRTVGEGRSATRAVGPVVAIFALPLLVALALEVQAFTDPTLLSIQRANRDAAEWIGRRLGEEAVLASWDAGAEGYFSHRRIINIDGVVNSYAYYQSMKEGTVAMFLRCKGLGYVVNHGVGAGGDGAGGDDVDIRNLIRDIYGPAAADASKVIERVPFDYSGTTNNGGFEQSGLRPMAVRVYEIPKESRGARPGDRCGEG